MRFLVYGGRDYHGLRAMQAALAQFPADAVLVHGAATGADSLAAWVWESWGRETEAHPADWQLHGRSAGPIRNQGMLDSGIDAAVAAPGGAGTADMTKRLRAAGIEPIHVVDGVA